MLLRWFNALLLKSGFRDELQIFIQPQCLVMLRIKRRFGNITIVERQTMAFEATEEANTTAIQSVSQDLWRPAISALGSALKESRWKHAIPTIVLSNHFVRYAIIPWNTELANAAERDAYLRHCFILTYGEAARQWDLRLDPAGFGQPALASGISKVLQEAIIIELEQARLPAQSIHPSLMLAANETRDYLGKEKAATSMWFVALEPGRLCLVLIEKGQWRSIKSIAAEADISRQLQALIQRESIMAGLDTTHWPVVIHSSGTGNADQIFLRGRMVKMVPIMTLSTPAANTYQLAI